MGYRQTLTVFLGSPGDLPDERDAVQATVEEMNRILANGLGYQLDLIRWEDSGPGFGNPQERLNRDLARADLFIGLLNRRWGSPPSPNGPYASGFEEEYRRSVERRTTTGTPEMMVLFKTVPPEFLADVGPDLRRVLDFRDELTDQKTIFYKTFDDVPDLQYRLRTALAGWLNTLAATGDKAESPDTAAEPALEPIAVPDPGVSNEELAFSAASSAFLSRLAIARRPEGRTTPVETARLRLLGARAGTVQNDALTLGPHDANLMYAEHPRDDLGEDDLFGLRTAGYDHFGSRNVPLWTWVRRQGADVVATVSLDSVMLAPGRPRAGAIRALDLLGGGARGSFFTQKDFATIWLDGSQDQDVRTSALEFLKGQGTADDLDALKRAFENKVAGQQEAVAIALISILSRTDRLEALSQLVVLAPSSPPAALVETVFEVAGSAPENVVLAALGHQSAIVRMAALRAAADRGMGPEIWSQALAQDEDADVRAEVVRRLAAAGRPLAPGEARAVLIRSAKNALWNFGGGKTTTGRPQWRDHQSLTLKSWTRSQIADVLKQDNDALLWLAYIGLLDDRNGLRVIVDQKGSVDLAALWPSDDGLRAPSPFTEDAAADLYAAAIDLLAAFRDPIDLARIRVALENPTVEPSQALLHYLAEQGDGSDVDRIFKATAETRGRGAASLLSFRDRRTEYGWAAEALATLAEGKWESLFNLAVAPDLLKRLVLVPPQKAWANISEGCLMVLLQNANDGVREATALRCVRDLPARRLRKLLARYLAETTRYYNVVHWLDFGVALPRELAIPATRRRLAVVA